MKFANGDVYTGQWFDGKQDGEGVLKKVSGKKLEGIWKEGDLRKGKVEYDNGDLYDGELK